MGTASAARTSRDLRGFLVVDVETTGLYASGNDRVIEIAARALDLTGEVEQEWATLINPERDVGETAIHGLRTAQLLNAPRFADVAGDLVDLLDGRVFVLTMSPSTQDSSRRSWRSAMSTRTICIDSTPGLSRAIWVWAPTCATSFAS